MQASLALKKSRAGFLTGTLLNFRTVFPQYFRENEKGGNVMPVRNNTKSTIVIGRFTLYAGERLPEVPRSEQEEAGIQRMLKAGLLIEEESSPAVTAASPQPEKESEPVEEEQTDAPSGRKRGRKAG